MQSSRVTLRHVGKGNESVKIYVSGTKMLDRRIPGSPPSDQLYLRRRNSCLRAFSRTYNLRQILELKKAFGRDVSEVREGCFGSGGPEIHASVILASDPNFLLPLPVLVIRFRLRFMCHESGWTWPSMVCPLGTQAIIAQPG